MWLRVARLPHPSLPRPALHRLLEVHAYCPHLEMWAPGLGGVGSSAEAPAPHHGQVRGILDPPDSRPQASKQDPRETIHTGRPRVPFVIPDSRLAQALPAVSTQALVALFESVHGWYVNDSTCTWVGGWAGGWMRTSLNCP